MKIEKTKKAILWPDRKGRVKEPELKSRFNHILKKKIKGEDNNE